MPRRTRTASHKAGADKPSVNWLVQLRTDPGDASYPWQEWHTQSYIIQEARRVGWMIIGSMEQAERKNAGKAKACGLTAGEPDMRVYLSRGRVVFIELKKLVGGVVSKVQEEYHAALKELGHMVRVVYAASPLDGWHKVKEILENESSQRI